MKSPRVSDLAVDEFRTLIKDTVLEALSEALHDPDEGLELREEMEASMEESLADLEAGGKTIPADEVAAKLGLKW